MDHPHFVLMDVDRKHTISGFFLTICFNQEEEEPEQVRRGEGLGRQERRDPEA